MKNEEDSLLHVSVNYVTIRAFCQWLDKKSEEIRLTKAAHSSIVTLDDATILKEPL